MTIHDATIWQMAEDLEKLKAENTRYAEQSKAYLDTVRGLREENAKLRAVLEEFAKDAGEGGAEGWYGDRAKAVLEELKRGSIPGVSEERLDEMSKEVVRKVRED